MISTVDVITEFITEYDWNIVDVLNAADGVQLITIKRNRVEDKINTYYYTKYIRLNLVIKGDTWMSILNPDEVTNYRVGDLSLNDPDSLGTFGDLLS